MKAQIHAIIPKTESDLKLKLWVNIFGIINLESYVYYYMALKESQFNLNSG